MAVAVSGRALAFQGKLRQSVVMDKQEHASRLRAAMAKRGASNEDVAAYTQSSTRSVINWRGGANLPLPADREKLRRLFPGYDEPGDLVLAALSQSELVEWRRDAVRSTYRRHLSEQREGLEETV